MIHKKIYFLFIIYLGFLLLTIPNYIDDPDNVQ